MSAHACIQCHKPTSKGRFARRAIAGSGGWSKGFQLPAWYCYKCLPQGQGRGEEGDIMAKKVAPSLPGSVSLTVSKDYVAEHDKVVALMPTLKTEVEELTIHSDEAYAYADALLGRIDQQRRNWGTIWDRIQEKTIKPFRSALDGLYDLNRDIDGPLEKMRDSVRKAMSAYKTEEARRIQAQVDADRREVERLERDARDAERKAALAATPQMRGRFQAQAEQRAEQASIAAQHEAPLPIAAANSGTRTIPKLRITDWVAFLQQALEDDLVLSCIPQEATEAAINKLWKAEPDVALWPGVEKFDEVQIVGRR